MYLFGLVYVYCKIMSRYILRRKQISIWKNSHQNQSQGIFYTGKVSKVSFLLKLHTAALNIAGVFLHYYFNDCFWLVCSDSVYNNVGVIDIDPDSKGSRKSIFVTHSTWTDLPIVTSWLLLGVNSSKADDWFNLLN